MASSSNDQVDLQNQLWHACAGLNVKVPCVGDKVFYFPQGHLDQVEAYTKLEGIHEMPSFGLPSKILCNVVDVQLKAEVETEELFAKITLIPDREGSRVRRSVPEKIPATFFRKRLTLSDIGPHVSLYKRHALQTLPPLDMSQIKPSQDLFAKDIHGKIWSFHHICRGVPNRHLLTTGWNDFVREKKLLAGDTFIFLRGHNEMYVGVERAVRMQKVRNDLSMINLQHGVIFTAFEAINKGTEFTVNYYPGISPSGFIVGYDEYIESLKVNYLPNTRVEMIFDEGEDPEFHIRRFTGMITGREDVDPFKWPHSEWQCLKVCWDATPCGHAPGERVSPWSIRSLDPVVPHHHSVGQKRSIPLNPIIGYNEGMREGKVLTLPKVNFPSSSGEDESKRQCGLFGVNIGYSNTGVRVPKPESQNYCGVTTPDTYIKVFEEGVDLGRCIDISRFSGYEGLVSEIERMFGFQGMLLDANSGWHVTYADPHDNKKQLGYLSWAQFKGEVRKIYICPKGKVPTWNHTTE